MSKRKNEISIMNVLLCFIVILIHLISKPVSALTSDAPLYVPYTGLWRLSTFVVQGFIFLSGMKIFLGNRREKYSVFLAKRVKTILIPYIAAVFVYYLFFVYVLKHFPFSIKDFAGYLIRGDIAAQFYFVIVIMQFYLLYPIWCVVLDRIQPLYAVIAAAAVNAVFGWYLIFISDKLIGYTPLFQDRIFTTYAIYWILGIYAGKYYDRFIGFINKHCVLVSVLAVMAAVTDAVTFLLNRYGRLTPIHLDMIHALYCLLIIPALFASAYKIKEHTNGFIRTMDKASYYIYLVHVLFIFILDKGLEYLGFEIGSVTLSFVFRCTVIYAACIAFAYVYSYLKQQSCMHGRKADITGR